MTLTDIKDGVIASATPPDLMQFVHAWLETVSS
jgi:hypothetical protein